MADQFLGPGMLDPNILTPTFATSQQTPGKFSMALDALRRLAMRGQGQGQGQQQPIQNPRTMGERVQNLGIGMQNMANRFQPQPPPQLQAGRPNMPQPFTPQQAMEMYRQNQMQQQMQQRQMGRPPGLLG